MRLKDLKEKYHVHDYEGLVQLYSKTEHGNRIAIKFIWYVKKHTTQGYFYVEGFKPTSKLDILEANIKEHVSNLPYDAEYYIPTYRKGLFEELIIHDYMTQTLGFEGNDFYKLKDKNIYGFQTSDITISFNGLSDIKGLNGDGMKEEVSVSLWTGDYSWISVKCKREVEAIKRAIDSILKPLLITQSVNYINLSDKMETLEEVDIIMNKFLLTSTNLKVNIKEHLKEQLLEMASKL